MKHAIAVFSMLGLLSAAASPAVSGQNTHLVPQQFAGIGLAIAAANPGDTVVVGPGVWFESIDFLGKDIMVVAAAGASQTTIDGNLAAPCVAFRSGESSLAVLDGFTLTHGLSAAADAGGGGLIVQAASPTIRNCVIRDCQARDSLPISAATAGGRHGGGALIVSGSPTFTACLFENNRAGNGIGPFVSGTEYIESSRGGHGGGIAVLGDSAPRFTNCIVRGCLAGVGGAGDPANAGGSGGGFYLKTNGQTIVIESSLIEGCYAGSGGPGDTQGQGGAAGTGGGIAVFGSTVLEIISTRITANRGGGGGSDSAYDGETGGLAAHEASTIDMRECTVDANLGGANSLYSNGGTGGMVLSGGSALVRRSVIADNIGATPGGVGGIVMNSQALIESSRLTGNHGGDGYIGYLGSIHLGGAGGITGGGTIRSSLIDNNIAGTAADTELAAAGGVTAGPTTTITSCTIVGNVGGASPITGSVGASAIEVVVGPLTLVDCIVSGDGASPLFTGAVSALAANHSCIAGGFPGLGNIDVDPMFVHAASGNYHLDASSPCIDAGDSAITLSFLDLDGDGRVFDGVVDIGADEFVAGLLAAGSGNVGSAAGGSAVDVLFIDGSAGGAPRRADIVQGMPFNLEVTAPPGSAGSAPFALFARWGVPGVADIYATFAGDLLFAPLYVLPGDPGLAVVANTLFSDPSALLSASPAPWNTTLLAPTFPLRITLQGVIVDAGGGFAITNGIVVNVVP